MPISEGNHKKGKKLCKILQNNMLKFKETIKNHYAKAKKILTNGEFCDTIYLVFRKFIEEFSKVLTLDEPMDE